MLITLSQSNPDPLYKQVTDQIRNAVITSQLKTGEPLPSIRALARDLQTSVITIKRAYTDLENEGYIITRPGLGSFITDISKERLREEKMEEIKERLKTLVNEGEKFNIKLDDIIRILQEMGGND